MSDKKYTLKEVLEKVKETLIKKTEEVKKKEEELKKEEKGVHKPAIKNKDQGFSNAGIATLSSKYAKEAGKEHKNKFYTDMGRELGNEAKEGHKKVLGELKSQPKPNLPKSEDGMAKSKEELKGVNKPAFTHLGTSEAGLYGTKGSSKEAKEYAKDSHTKVLNELKDQKKPNLPKSEDSSLKEFLKKKSMKKCGEMSKEEGAGPGMAPGNAPKQPKAPTMPKQPKVNQGY